MGLRRGVVRSSGGGACCCVPRLLFVFAMTLSACATPRYSFEDRVGKPGDIPRTAQRVLVDVDARAEPTGLLMTTWQRSALLAELRVALAAHKLVEVDADPELILVAHREWATPDAKPGRPVTVTHANGSFIYPLPATALPPEPMGRLVLSVVKPGSSHILRQIAVPDWFRAGHERQREGADLPEGFRRPFGALMQQVGTPVPTP